MKDLATNTRDKPSQIFAQVVSQCNDNVQALLPSEEKPKRTIRYQRPTPPVPATYADVRLPEEYTIQRPECRTQNVSLLLTREFRMISQSPDLLHVHGRYLLCTSAPI